MDKYLKDFNLLDKIFDTDIKTPTNEEEKEEKVETTECCDNPVFIINSDTKCSFCSSCGFTKDDYIVNSTKQFLNDSAKSVQTSEMLSNILLPKTSLTTYIRGANNYFNQIHLYHRPTEERGLIEVFYKIDSIIKKLNIPSKIGNNAKYYYKEMCEDQEDGSLTRGDIRIGLIIACIYISCKNNNKAMNIEDLSSVLNVDKKIITKGLKRVTEIEKRKNIKINRDTSNIHDYINKYLSILNINDPEFKDLIHLIYERGIRINIIKNSTYNTICAGLIYLIIKRYDVKITKKQLLKIIDISEVTMNKIYNYYKRYEKILFIGL